MFYNSIINTNKSTKILPFWPIKRMHFRSPQRCALFYANSKRTSASEYACVCVCVNVLHLNKSQHYIDYYVYWFTAQVFISTLNSYLFVCLALFPEFIWILPSFMYGGMLFRSTPFIFLIVLLLLVGAFFSLKMFQLCLCLSICAWKLICFSDEIQLIHRTMSNSMQCKSWICEWVCKY